MTIPAGARGYALLGADLACRSFAPGRGAGRRIGAEVELLPIDADTRCIAALDHGAHAMLPMLRRFGASRCWSESRTEKGTPAFLLPNGGRLTFEPGGQIEYAAAPALGASALAADIRGALEPLRDHAADAGLALVAAGIEAERDVWSAPRQLEADRYRHMEAYFAAIGPNGARMMRQTASLQVCLDIASGDAGRRQWRVLNAAAPYVVAIFANSPRYDGMLTGHQSVRAACWRRLDPARTGIVGGDDPVAAYLDFALRAPDMMRRTADGAYRPFGDWVDADAATMDDWHHHLTTLFPEVRPRGYLEVRGADAIDPSWCIAPLALLGGLAYDPTALADALDALDASGDALECAGYAGLRDPAVAAVAGRLVEVALDGCARLGPGFIGHDDLTRARSFFEQYTLRRRSPADDVRDAAAAATA